MGSDKDIIISVISKINSFKPVWNSGRLQWICNPLAYAHVSSNLTAGSGLLVIRKLEWLEIPSLGLD